MANFIVGDANCSFVHVCETMYKSVTSQTLVENWRTFARRLGTTEREIETLTSLLNRELEEPKGILIRVLTMWRGRYGADATLEVLVNRLMTMGLNDIAETLKKEFYEESSQNTNIPTHIVHAWPTGNKIKPDFTVVEPPLTEVTTDSNSWGNNGQVQTLPKTYNVHISNNQCNQKLVIIIVVAATIIILPLVIWMGSSSSGRRMMGM